MVEHGGHVGQLLAQLEELGVADNTIVIYSTIPDYPFQAGSSLTASGIGYGMLRQQEALKRLKEMETIMLKQ